MEGWKYYLLLVVSFIIYFCFVEMVEGTDQRLNIFLESNVVSGILTLCIYVVLSVLYSVFKNWKDFFKK